MSALVVIVVEANHDALSGGCDVELRVVCSFSRHNIVEHLDGIRKRQLPHVETARSSFANQADADCLLSKRAKAMISTMVRISMASTPMNMDR